MKMIQAIIQPHRLDVLRDALQKHGVAGMTACQAQGFGRQKGHKEIYRGAEYEVSFLPKMAVEIVVNDDEVADTCAAIVKTTQTGTIGDGKIFILDVGRAVRIRTGETGVSAV